MKGSERGELASLEVAVSRPSSRRETAVLKARHPLRRSLKAASAASSVKGEGLWSSVVRRCLGARAVLLDVLGFPVVDLDDLLAVVALEPQNLIQLRVQRLKLAVLRAHNKAALTWRRTFPECAPGTDGVALFEGRVIGRVRLLAELPRDPKPWMWRVTDPTLAGQPGWADTQGEVPSRRQAMDRLIERWQELRRLKPT